VALDLFAGISVSDDERALTWYERLLGSPPSFVAHATEAVWELAAHRFVFIEEQVKDAGHAQHTIFVEDLDALVEQITGRGLDPVEREPYSNGVRKVTYRDPDGNEIGFGGAPEADTGGP
jgi:catechol 2,3-dioxygenase-like lactoylglutathione lyase family enzyme